MNSRLRALCDMSVAGSRGEAGLHEYDGRIQDLSPDGVRRGLAALGGTPLTDAHDEAHVSAFEKAARVRFGDLELHRSNPMIHASNLDLTCYDRDYAPEPERSGARARHLAAWPDGVDMAIASLDAVPRPTAAATMAVIEGLAASLVEGRSDAEDAALRAHARLVDHLRAAADHGDPETALGADALAALLGSAEALDVDLAELRAIADSERDRMRDVLEAACAELSPGEPVGDVLDTLLRDHPDDDGVFDAARAITEEVIAWTRQNNLVPYYDGICLVGPAPESMRWATAMMSWAAPRERPGPSWYWINPSNPEWPADEREEWLRLYSATTLPAITVHEVAPGHYSHGIALRHAPTMVRRTLFGDSFVEGWAHYVEEVAVEEGFRARDPRFVIGVAIEALVRITRLACSIGLHTGEMTVEDAAARFTRDAYLAGPAALAEAQRGTFDPTYGRYTWGKLVIRAARDRARAAWGDEFSLPRFHRALLDLGAPPLGLVNTAVERG